MKECIPTKFRKHKYWWWRKVSLPTDKVRSNRGRSLPTNRMKDILALKTTALFSVELNSCHKPKRHKPCQRLMPTPKSWKETFSEPYKRSLWGATFSVYVVVLYHGILDVGFGFVGCLVSSFEYRGGGGERAWIQVGSWVWSFFNLEHDCFQVKAVQCTAVLFHSFVV